MGDADSVCGDGQLDPGEACDDGNPTRADGCSPACLASGTHLDCITLLEAPQADVVGLVAGEGGSFIAAGRMSTDAGGRAWVGRFEPDGTKTWFHELDAAAGVDEAIFDVTGDGESGAWFLLETGMRHVVQHVDAEGELGPRIGVGMHDGVAIAARTLEYVGGAGDGPRGVWIAGTTHGDAWVGRLDSKGLGVTTLLAEDHVGHQDTIRALAHADGEIVVAATMSTSSNASGDHPLVADTEIILIRYDEGGTELGRSTLGASQFGSHARHARGLAFGGDAWFVAGWQEPKSAFEPYQAWVERSTPSALEWSSMLVGESASYDAIIAIDEHVVVAGSTAQGAGWFTGFDGAGSWSWDYEHEPASWRHVERELVEQGDGLVRGVETLEGDAVSMARSCIISI